MKGLTKFLFYYGANLVQKRFSYLALSPHKTDNTRWFCLAI